MTTSLLLVDDHALFLDSLRTLLTTHGYHIAGTAADGLEAPGMQSLTHTRGGEQGHQQR